jgi:hypothetical protein
LLNEDSRLLFAALDSNNSNSFDITLDFKCWESFKLVFKLMFSNPIQSFAPNNVELFQKVVSRRRTKLKGSSNTQVHQPDFYSTVNRIVTTFNAEVLMILVPLIK